MMKNKITPLLVVCAFVMGGCASNGGKNDAMTDFGKSASKVGSSIGGAISGYVTGYEQGIYVPQEALAKIKPGKSRAGDVVALIGQPPEKSQVGKKEVWSYPYTKLPIIGASTNETTVIEFNTSGVVLSAYKAGGRQSKTGNPLVDKANGLN